MDYPEEIEEAYDVSVDDVTAMDCALIAGMLLDMDMPVPTDVIAKAHKGGIYIAH